jgi:quercetin dioxygenase-like cupin family protein
VERLNDILVGPGDGETITARERRDVVLLADHEELSMTRSRYAPGERGPDPHVHREHTDAFYVLDGEMTYTLGAEGERVTVPAGGFVAVPPNLVHSFVNEGGVDTHFLNFHSPDGGFAAFMRGARDGAEVGFDSFEPPANGGIPLAEGIVSGPGEGERLVNGSRVVFLKGVLPDICFAEFHFDGPFDGPEIRHHDAQVDSFYVLDGELEMTVEDAVHSAGPGTLASVPPGVRHSFGHRGGRSRVLNVHTPDGGFGEFLRRISTPG